MSDSLLARMRGVITNALKFWEPRRIIYNAALAAVVLGYFAASWPRSRAVVDLNGILFLFILAVLANVAYCAAYLADMFIQFSAFERAWHRWRWILFIVGTLFAAAITRFFAIGFFSSP
jgi:hypothetical protein